MPLLPQLTAENTAFWTGGERGKLMVARCDSCRRAIHPPELICPHCLNRSVTPYAVSGRGVVHSFTVNHQQWMPDLKVPYVVAIVALDDHPDVRITAQMVDIAPEAVRIGAPVEVTFEQAEDVWLPRFRPAA